MSVLHFAWPWLFVALALPLLARALLPAVHGGAALRVPTLPAGAPGDTQTRPAWPLALAALAWLLLVAAAARPQLPPTPTPQAASGRDLMLAFDVSMSMATADLRLGEQTVERLQAARALADDFLQRRGGDRVGLVVFGAQAYLHTPLTFDLRAVRAALGTAQAGLAGRETALGDAIALATRHLSALPDSARVLVLLTDGTNTSGTLTPARSAWLARRENVRIHALGIGASADLNEAALRDIARQTGGSYARATDSAGIARFLQAIESAEPIVRESITVRPMRELYAWPLSLALLLAGALAWRYTREVAA